MSNGNNLSGFKVGKLYICRNPLPEDYDEYYWVLFAGINNWDEHTNILYANHTFMVLEIFSYIGSDFEGCSDKGNLDFKCYQIFSL